MTSIKINFKEFKMKKLVGFVLCGVLLCFFLLGRFVPVQQEAVDEDIFELQAEIILLLDVAYRARHQATVKGAQEYLPIEVYFEGDQINIRRRFQRPCDASNFADFEAVSSQSYVVDFSEIDSITIIGGSIFFNLNEETKQKIKSVRTAFVRQYPQSVVVNDMLDAGKLPPGVLDNALANAGVSSSASMSICGSWLDNPIINQPFVTLVLRGGEVEVLVEKMLKYKNSILGE